MHTRGRNVMHGLAAAALVSVTLFGYACSGGETSDEPRHL